MNPCKIIACLLLCAFHWLPVALAERTIGRVHLGRIGCTTYSLFWVVLALWMLAPSEQRR